MPEEADPVSVRLIDEQCPHCGTAYTWHRKFNNGTPKEFLLPNCTCEEDIKDTQLDEWLGQRKRPHDENPTT